MKPLKLTALLLTLLMLLASCGESVPAVTVEDGTNTLAIETEEPADTGEKEERRVGAPMSAIPSYVLPEGASTDEIRAMAVKAMRDELTVQWFVDKNFTYLNADGGEFKINSREVYAGLPYTQSGSGLLQWLQYYDPDTGRMHIGNDIQGFLGNSCAASVMWGWSSVCTSISWNTTYLMTPGHGCLPVGGYKVDMGLMDYREHTTKQIVEDNGEEAIMRAYAAVLPADGLISVANSAASGAHAQMVIEPAHVVMNADGTFNRDESYIMIQDQHKGAMKTGAPFVTEVDGQKVHYAGHVADKMTFTKLLANSYIPVTTAEFTGAKPYTVPAASAEGAESAATMNDLKQLTITSPYKIITVRVVIRDGEEEKAEGKKVFGRVEIENGSAHSYDMSSFLMPAGLGRKLEKGKAYTMSLEVLLAPGNTVTLAEIPYTYNG